MGEHISQGGVSLRVRGVKVPRGTRRFFLPLFLWEWCGFYPLFLFRR